VEVRLDGSTGGLPTASLVACGDLAGMRTSVALAVSWVFVGVVGQTVRLLFRSAVAFSPDGHHVWRLLL
jgi:hypothetical protein